MGRTTVRLDVPTSDYPRATAAVRPAIVLVVVLAAAGLGLGSWAFLASGEIAGVALGISILLLLLVGAGVLLTFLALPRRGRLEFVTEDGRLWLPPARPLRALTLGGLLVCIALGLVVLVGLLVERSLAGPVVPSVGAVVLAAACVPVLLAHLRGDAVPPRIGLGPDDLVRQSGRTVQVVRWDDVVAVDVVTDPAPRVLLRGDRPVLASSTSRPTPGERPVGGPAAAPDQLPIPTNLHGSDPRLIELLLRHYLRNRVQRAELGTTAAEERIARGDLHA